MVGRSESALPIVLVLVLVLVLVMVLCGDVLYEAGALSKSMCAKRIDRTDRLLTSIRSQI